MKDNLIQNKSFDFSLKIIELYRFLKEQKEFIISKQILKSGTSIGANIEESLAGQSKKDFISKMTIANKEARETRYWLRLLEKSNLVSYDYNWYLTEIESIINILTSIIKSSQKTIA